MRNTSGSTAIYNCNNYLWLTREYLLPPRETWRTINVIFMTINSSRLPTITLATFFSTGEHGPGSREQRRSLIRQTLFSVPTMETGYSPRSNFPYFYPTFWDKYFLDKFVSFSSPGWEKCKYSSNW